jgi:hypothetical protein
LPCEGSYFFNGLLTFLFGRKEKSIRIRRISKRKARERLRRSELCKGFGIVLAFYLLEKFLKWGLGRNFFQKVSPPFFLAEKKSKTKEKA